MRNLFLAILFFGLLFVGYTITDTSTTHEIDSSPIQDNDKHESLHTADVKVNSLKHKENNFSMKETVTKNILHRQEVSVKSIFTEESIDDIALIVKPMEGVKPKAALRMKKGMIQNAKIGDTILLPSIDGVDYEVHITHLRISQLGNVSIDGSYEEDGITYHSILTEGQESAFVSMSTPSGTYEVEFTNGLGYIYSSTEIENSRIDYEKTDTLTHEESESELQEGML